MYLYLKLLYHYVITEGLQYVGSILNEPSVKSIQSVSKDQFKPCDSGNKGFILQNAVSHLRVTVISLVHITVKSVVYVRQCTMFRIEFLNL